MKQQTTTSEDSLLQKIQDYVGLSWREVKHQKLRSWLTLLGFVIGISSVVALITLGAGLENAISSQFDALGSDKLVISPKGSFGAPGLANVPIIFDEDDLEVLDSTQGISRATGFSFDTQAISSKDQTRYFITNGIATNPKEQMELSLEFFQIDLAKGRMLENGDSYKIMVGNNYLTGNIFEDPIDVGDSLSIGGKEFEVIGIWEKLGSAPDDTSVTMPLETYHELFDPDKTYDILVAQTSSGENINAAALQLEKALRDERNQEEGKEDFVVETPQQLAGGFLDVLNIVRTVLVGIAGISLLVGGIGIMNTTYTSVLQRTKEIGVMKATGAKDRQIASLFLIESGMYGLAGGIIGIVIGLAIAKLGELIVSFVAGPALLQIHYDPRLLGSALLLSIIFGALSGLAPSLQAARLKPVDALRH